MPYRRIYSLFIILSLIFVTLSCGSERATSPKTTQILLLEYFEDRQLYAVHLVSLKNEQKTILRVDEGYTLTNRAPEYLDFSSSPNAFIRIMIKTGERIEIDNSQATSESNLAERWTTQILAQVTPLSGPHDFYPLPNDPDAAIFSMTGPSDTYLNLYLLDADGNIQQLTHVEALVAENDFLLSASAEFINWRPFESLQFLYRARLRDGEGQDFNELRLYNLTENFEIITPYFGKNPVWSADGKWLAGVRLNKASPPLYILWRVELETGKEVEMVTGCNPRWSVSGEWLAYDGHDNSQWQGYTDCYTNGRAYAQNIETGGVIELSQGYEGQVHVIGWVEN